MKVAVIPNLDKRGSTETVEKLGHFLKESGIKAYVPNNICCSGYDTAPENELYRIADVIITIGGDGTIIRYAKRAAADNKPILGINAGRMGYLADLEQSEYKLTARLKGGDYRVEKRMMLKVRVCENGRTVGEYDALNDAVITSGFIARIIDVSASVDGDSIAYRADGIIISTPTGSTAYSMSAGGPVIDPDAECICLTPICSHSLSAKPILLSSSKTVKLKAFSKKRTEIFLSVDGRKVCGVKPYTEIYITRSERYVQLVRLSNRTFYKNLSAKFLDSRSVVSEK